MNRFLPMLFAALLQCAALSPSWAQAPYPSQPVKIVVPFAAGANTDLLARMYAQVFTEALGQRFIVENKPGGGTNIAAESVAHAAPDGYTLFVAQFASHAANKWLYDKLNYDPVKDFAPVGMMAETPFFLLVNAKSPFHTVSDLVNFGKQKPGGLSYGSSAVGSPIHIAGELLRMQAGIKAVHVPYKGAGPAAIDLVGGNLDFMFDATAMSLVRSGQLRALAVADSERWPGQPGVPSMAEQGFPNFSVKGFFALVAPARTPEPVLERLNAIMVEYAKRADVQARMTGMQVSALPISRAQTQAYLERESTRWEQVVKASGAKAE
ncbi:MAG: Tricarboxylate transport protein TctC [Ramlibacter sp.]|nr:Tricarboxylate transport protein TctC [Ramlibacter sp.]